ncbi:MAG TPA: UvrY/SirA/GacA family response regulator transcription factor [Pseudomonadales bacterium]|nr:two-component system response regulator UvrY [Gammaproteobacteria bacterium]MDP6027024.1 UvrY/SirA/GacA family response regulator transcription factor [Pseudomonadales bacterium]MDP6317645.1 UvrY/SirA/GacA family response regulator transcription factor [Pseudomonadales bacterium]HJL61792.1 UvrY/SirA/GacA family response regulator transcription factor [Pseudomonadales bacterium]HJP51898.1 UvrY/SirA/GacA family response regulator transcription factor [Pseudomonadales bacterium]
MIRILVVDDHQLVRTGTSRLLADIEGLEVVGQADSGEQAIDMVRDLNPDVVLMDVKMPGIGGLEATRRCLRVDPDLKIVAVTVHEDEPYPSKLMKVGAVGYLTKQADLDEMVRAIKKVVSGQRYISSEVAQQLALRPYSTDELSPFEALSGREMQITLMVINGDKVSEISKNLSLSPKTVNSYRYRIFEKLDISNDVGLTKMAIKYGVIDSEAVA